MQTTPTTTPFAPNFWACEVVKELLPKKVQTQVLDIRKKNHHN
jgi:hypothetical protein